MIMVKGLKLISVSVPTHLNNSLDMDFKDDLDETIRTRLIFNSDVDYFRNKIGKYFDVILCCDYILVSKRFYIINVWPEKFNVLKQVKRRLLK